MNLAWLRSNWPVLFSVFSVAGLALIVVRAAVVSHGRSAFVLLFSGDNFVRAAGVVGFELIVWAIVGGLIFALPGMLIHPASDDNLAVGVLGVVSLLLLQSLLSIFPTDLLVTAAAAVVGLIAFELIARRQFSKYDVGRRSQILQRIEENNIWTWGKRPRQPKTQGPRQYPENDPVYKRLARSDAQALAALLAVGIVVLSLFRSTNMWFPLEKITLENHLQIRSVYVVDETDIWLTTLRPTDGFFQKIRVSDVAKRTYCTSSDCR